MALGSLGVFAKDNVNLKACVQQVCGPAKQVPNPGKKLQEFAETPSPFDSVIEREIFPLIEKHIRESADEDTLYKEILEKEASKLFTAPLTPTQKVFLNFFAQLRAMGAYLKYLDFTDEKKEAFKLDEKKKPELLKIKTQQAIDKELPGVLLLVNSKTFMSYLFSLNVKAWVFYAKMYPEKTYTDAIKDDVAYLDGLMTEIYAELPILKTLISANPEFRAVKRSNYIDSAMATSFMRFRFTVTMLHDFLKKEELKELRTRPTRIDEVITMDTVYTNLKLLEVETKPSFVESKIELAKESCLTALRKAVNSVPSDAAKKEMTRAINEVRRQAVDFVASITFLPHADIAKKINAIEFFYPDSPSEVITSVNSFFTEQLGANKETLSHLRTRTIDNELVLLGILQKAMGSSSTVDAEDTQAANLCKSLAPTSFPDDFSMTGKAKINLSWQSFFFRDFGLSIATHEIGHAAEDVIKASATGLVAKLSFAISKSCVMGLHPGQKDQLYFSEDFADAFAAKILNTSRGNFACSFLPQKNGDYNYDWIKLANGDSTDPHSSMFFRALHWSVYTQPLTRECRAVVEEDSNFKMHMCF